jgi:hypothetical protein
LQYRAVELPVTLEVKELAFLNDGRMNMWVCAHVRHK